MPWLPWFAAAVHLAAAGPDFGTDAQVQVLDNGLVVVVEADPRTDRVVVHVRYAVGSRDERPGERGGAHLVEHLLFEGSAHVPPLAFDRWLAEAGGWSNAWTSEDQTAYHLQVQAGALDLALFLESDRLGFLLEALDPEKLEVQRRVVLQERAERFGRPNGRDVAALQGLLFPEGHPYHHPVIGTLADIGAWDLQGVAGFVARHYRPGNAVLVVVGAVEPEAVIERARHWYADVEGRPVEPRGTPDPVAPRRVDAVLEDDVVSRTLYLGWPTVPLDHRDAPALELLSWVLANGPGTPMEDQLASRSRVSTADAWTWHGELGGMFVLEATAAHGHARWLERVLERTLKDLRREPPSQAALDRARRALRRTWLQAREDPVSWAEVLADCQALHGRPDCAEERWAAYEAVTPADLQRVAEVWLLPEARSSLSVVPAGAGGALRDARPVEVP